MTVTNEIKKLEKAFEVFNERFYGNELKRPVIQFYADTKEKTYGWITTSQVWNENGYKTYEINICANFADRGMAKIYATLLHEMAHLYNLEHGIIDTSSNGYYHNKNFRKTAEEHGLIVSKDSKYGWSVTNLNENAESFINDTFISENLTMKYQMPPKKEKTKKQNSFKHVCPNCGAIARTSKDGMHLVCGDCMVEMIQED